MAKRRMGSIALLLCLCLWVLPCFAMAASTQEASEPVDPNRPCTLTLTYSCEGEALPNLPVRIYDIARVSADFQYTLTEEFALCGLTLNGVQSTGEWDVIRDTLEAWILAQSIAPKQIVTTDELGQGVAENLQPGLYLAVVDHVTDQSGTCTFAGALVALPGLGTDGTWQYQVAVAPKGQRLPPEQEEIQWKVLKLWKGETDSAKRPQSIQVEIYRNGEACETVTLSEANQWSYSWTAPSDGATWKVVERNVPEGYTVTVEKRETTFVLTNTYEDPGTPPPPPQTGDTANVMLYIVLMNISGILLLILGLVGKKKRL